MEALQVGVPCVKVCRKGKTHASVLRVRGSRLEWKRAWYHLVRWGKLELAQCGALEVEGERAVIRHVARDLVVVVENASDLVLALEALRKKCLEAMEKPEEVEEV